MERIIQLSESEYNKLQSDADMKHNEILRRAEELYQKKGTYGIKLEIDCQQDYLDELSFKASSYVKDWDGRFPISEDDKEKIIKFVNRRALKMMEDKFGRQIKNINIWNKRLELLRNWKMKFIGLTIFGWLAALALLIVALIK